jgi:hypothetical protein
VKWTSLAVLALALAVPTLAAAAPPTAPPTTNQAPADGRVVGRVVVAASRAPVADATVIVVAAPSDVRSGARAREPLDPESVDWTRETITDASGGFSLDAVPTGKVRVVVIALGYERLEMWAESSSDARELTLFVRPEYDRFRTEVAVDRNLELPRAEHFVDGERARSYPGSGGDPVRAAQNLPGVARAPGGLGLIAVRGGDPRQTAIYVDGHPVPRGFHVLPIAAVIEPSMIDRVELTPGNVDAAYGGFSGGLLEIQTLRTSGKPGIHGEAHVDLFDVGGAVRAPVGPGGVAFGFRRAHVGDVVKLADDVVGKTGILVPNYWDYFGRFDMPIRRDHHLIVKAFGAGDGLSDTTEFTPGSVVEIDFKTSFHRFDLGYAYTGERLRASVSGAMLIDSTLQETDSSTKNRVARTPSLRASLSYRLAKSATLLAGADFARTRANRQTRYSYDDELNESESKPWKFGSWLGVAFQAFPETGLLVIRPQVRINVFGTSTETRASVDPRLDVRARVHERVELFAAAGQFSAPYSPFVEDRLGLIDSTDTSAAHIVIPDWLVNYFDPATLAESPEGYLLITRTYQASLGVQVALPGDVGLRSTLFWRETPGSERGWPADSGGFFGVWDLTVRSPAERAYGLEVLLDRSLGERVSGMIGYTLLRADITESEYGLASEGGKLVPASFDQRHNLVALLVVELPRAFRFGARFRLVSGNPEQPVIGTKILQMETKFFYQPIYGEFGSRYSPMFHQLDLRIDKTWYMRAVSLIAYLDIQNVYNRIYPEIWVYSFDWTERGQRIGLPIFPSLGLRAEF